MHRALGKYIPQLAAYISVNWGQMSISQSDIGESSTVLDIKSDIALAQQQTINGEMEREGDGAPLYRLGGVLPV